MYNLDYMIEETNDAHIKMISLECAEDKSHIKNTIVGSVIDEAHMKNIALGSVVDEAVLGYVIDKACIETIILRCLSYKTHIKNSHMPIKEKPTYK